MPALRRLFSFMYLAAPHTVRAGAYPEQGQHQLVEDTENTVSTAGGTAVEARWRPWENHARKSSREANGHMQRLRKLIHTALLPQTVAAPKMAA
jgi:hypothetical protein